MISHTAHHFNYVNLGVSLNPETKGKRFDLCQATNAELGIEDAQVFSIEWDRYADAGFIKQIISIENPDALVFITDPRQYIDLFAIEHDKLYPNEPETHTGQTKVVSKNH